MRGNRARELSLEQAVQRVFLRIADGHGGVFYHHAPLRVLLDLQGGGRLLMCGHGGEQVEHHLVVNLHIAHTDGDRLIETRRDLMIHLCDGPRHDATVLVLGAAAGHGKGLACSCLAIAHDGPVVPLHYRGN